MNWKPAIVTDCFGNKTANPWFVLEDRNPPRYTVCKVVVMGQVWFEAWRLRDDYRKTPSIQLGRSQDPNACRQMCSDHGNLPEVDRVNQMELV